MITGGLHKRGGIWYAVWRQDGKQRWRSTGKARKADAQAVLSDLVAPLNAGDRARAFREAADAAYERKGEMTGRALLMDRLWDTFRTAPERPDAAEITTREYRRQFTRMLSWVKANHPRVDSAADLSPGIASAFAQWLATQVGAPTFNKNIQAMRLVWKVVGRRTGWSENPWTHIALRRYQAIAKRELTADEIRRLIEADTGEWRTLVMIGTFTALRLADCATLRWDEVDLRAGVILRTPRKTARRTGKLVRVPLFSQLQAELQSLYASRQNDYVLPDLAARYLRKHSALEKHIGRMFRRAGIRTTSDAPLPDTRVRRPVVAGFHSLRHSFVSMCRRADVPEAVVMSIVGHGSPAMTRHYTHVGDAAARLAIDSLPRIAEPAAPDDTRRDPLPQWAADELAGMTYANWRDVRSAMLADATPCLPANTRTPS